MAEQHYKNLPRGRRLLELVSTADIAVELSVEGGAILGSCLAGLAGSQNLGLAVSSRLGDRGGTAKFHNVRVEILLEGLDLEGVALEGADGGLGAAAAGYGLDLIRLDDTVDVGVGDLGAGRSPVLLGGGAAVEFVEGVEGGLGPDDETPNTAGGGELEDVQGADTAQGDAGKIADSKREGRPGVVDDQRAELAAVTSVPGLALAGAQLLGVVSLLDISVGTELLEGLDGQLGLVDVGERSLGDDQRDLLQGLDAVSAGLNEGRDGRSSESGGDGKPALADVDLPVPPAPDLGGIEHAASTAHVTEGGLARAVGTTSLDTGDTRHSATSPPRFSRGLVTGLLGHGVRLTVVLVDLGVDELDDVGTDGAAEHLRQGSLRSLLALSVVDSD